MFRPAVLCLAALALVGCDVISDGLPPVRSSLARGSFQDPAEATYGAVDRMLDTAPASLAGSTIVLGAITDRRGAGRGAARDTPLGTLLADHVRTRLVQRGIAVSDLRARPAVRLVRAQSGAADVLTGTYALGQTQVHVSLKVVAAGSARVLAAADLNLPRTPDLDALLGVRRAVPQFVMPPEPRRSLF